MPRELALLLCTGFVLFLLWLERKESADVSAAAWVPTLWMLAIASKPLGVWFGTVGDAESGSPLDRFVLLGLALAGAMVIARRDADWRHALSAHGWLLALVAYMLASTLWSDMSFVALKRWTRDVIVVVMALVLLTEDSPKRALESIIRRSAYVLIPFSIMLVKYYPSFGREYARWSGGEMWVGVTLHKNTLGRLCLVSSFFLAWALFRLWAETYRQQRDARERRRPPSFPRRGWADLIVLLIALYLLKGSETAYSATSIGTFAVGLGTFAGLRWMHRTGIRVPAFGLAAVLVLVVFSASMAPFLGGSNLAGISSAFGRNETLTGRTQTWSELVPVFKQQPLAGSGYASFWTSERREFYQMSHGHNGYLDILLDLGLIGLALYFAWLVACAQKMHRALAQDNHWAAFAVSFLLMVGVYNTTESALNSLAEQMTAVLVLASIVVPYERTAVSARSRLGLRVHVPAKRDAGAAPAQPGSPDHRWALPVLDRGRGQRRRRLGARDGGTRAGRTAS